MSIRITSGSTVSASCTASAPSLGVPDDLEPVVGSEDRLERPARTDGGRPRSARGSLSGMLTAASTTRSHPQCDLLRSICEGDEARERIQKLLVTGRQPAQAGVDPAKARQSYEQALEAAREAGLEDAIRPLVEIRLADLERLARESPPPSPPDA